MNNERKTLTVNLNEENENMTNDEKRDEIDREFYTEHGGEG